MAASPRTALRARLASRIAEAREKMGDRRYGVFALTLVGLFFLVPWPSAARPEPVRTVSETPPRSPLASPRRADGTAGAPDGEYLDPEATFDVSVHLDESNRVTLLFQYSGLAGDVRRGVAWSRVLPNGTRVPVARLDWQGYHHRAGGAGHSGDVLIVYGPATTRREARVVNASEAAAAAVDDRPLHESHAVGWLRLPARAQGLYECAGYGRSRRVRVTAPARVALLPEPDRLAASKVYFTCLGGEDEPRSASERPRDLTIEWWTRGRRLVSAEWRANDGPEARVRWEYPPDPRNPVAVDPLRGDLLLFDLETVNRLRCLWCTRRGPDFVSRHRPDCDRDDDGRADGETGEDEEPSSAPGLWSLALGLGARGAAADRRDDEDGVPRGLRILLTATTWATIAIAVVALSIIAYRTGQEMWRCRGARALARPFGDRVDRRSEDTAPLLSSAFRAYVEAVRETPPPAYTPPGADYKEESA